jgi:four helix bundle protein
MDNQENNEKGLKSLVVWQKALQFAIFICKNILPKFPEDEKWALTSQLRRSVQSVPANIAEGYGRYYFQEGVRFAYIARGSLEETHNHLTFANRMQYLSEIEYQKLEIDIDELKRLINGFINYLKKSKRGINEVGAHYFTDSEPIRIEQNESSS